MKTVLGCFKTEARPFTIKVGRVNGSFGMTVVGRTEPSGIYIQKTIMHGAAYNTKKIRPGLRILSINDKNTVAIVAGLLRL